MNYQYVPYLWPLCISGLFSITLGLYVFVKHRKARGATSFICSMFIVTLWSLPNALEMAGTDLSTKLFWANVQYFAFCYSPVSVLAMCMEFTGYDRWLRSRKIILLAILPTIILFLVWTNGMHGLIRYDIHLEYGTSFSVIAKKYGFAFFIHAIYSHILTITGIVLLIKAVFFKITVYRKQAIPLLIGVGMIVVPNIVYVIGLSPFNYDITPAIYGPSGCIIAWGIFRFKFFELVPLARTTVIESMEAGVMVLDLQDRVLDINPAFKEIIGLSDPKITERRVEEVCAIIPELVQACKDRRITHTEFSIITKEFTKIYEVLFSPLTDDKMNLIGRLAVTYDITKKKQVEQEYFKQQWKLAVVEERERMARDMHDNLGQVLGFINLQAQAIRQELLNVGVETILCKIDKLVDVTQMAHTEIREYISNIRNSSYLEKDFITALKKNIMSFEEQTGSAVKLDIASEITGEEFQPYIWLDILNIIKETLNNIRKHAEAKNISILFEIVVNKLFITVEDDGKGFDTVINPNKIITKFGLDIMRERANEIGGEIRIESKINVGSRIMLCVPIVKGDKNNANEIDVSR